MEQPNRSKPFISSSKCLLSQHYITTFQLRAVYRLPTAKPYFFSTLELISVCFFSEPSERNAQSVAGTLRRLIGCGERRIRSSISRASRAISVGGSCQPANSLRWSTSRSYANRTTTRWMGRRHRVTVSGKKRSIRSRNKRFFSFRWLRLRWLQQKQIEAHSHNLHRRATASTTSQLYHRQQSRWSRSRAHRQHDRPEQARDASLVPELSSSPEKAQVSSRRWPLAHSNPPAHRSTRHLHGDRDNGGRVKRGLHALTAASVSSSTFSSPKLRV